MATKTSNTKKTAAKTKAAPKTNARAANVAPKAKAKRTVAPIAKRTAATIHAPFENVDVKTALFGAGIGAALGTLATKLIFFR